MVAKDAFPNVWGRGAFLQKMAIFWINFNRMQSSNAGGERALDGWDVLKDRVFGGDEVGVILLVFAVELSGKNEGC